MKLAVLLAALAVLSPAPSVAQAGLADPDSLIWTSEEAAIDSLNTYWRNLDNAWYEPLTLEDLDVGLTPVRLDSLTIEGDTVISRMIAGRPWRVRWGPVRRLRFNRVQGLDLGGEVVLYRPGLRQPRLVSNVSYGLSWKRLSHAHSLSVPLVTARLRDDEGYLDRAPWTWLTLEATGGREADWFAGDLRTERNLSALINGKDPNQYYDLAHWRAGLRIRPRPPLSLLLGGGGGRHRPLGVATDWNLIGDRATVDDNLAVEGLSRRMLYAGLQVNWRGLWLYGLHEWLRVSDSPLPDVVSAPDGAAWYRHFVLKARWHVHDRWGDVWMLRVNWNNMDRQAPREWKTDLGDHGTLRGFEAGELVGDRGGWASLDIRWNLDPFKSLRVPLLKGLGLQPIIFVDGGRVYRHDGALDNYDGGKGWRADVGLGLGKYLGMGRGLSNVRFYAAKPVGVGADGRPWVLTVALEVW